ncbi:MAG: hypothetical protein GXY76_18630 [Chloroflexi bacterium]|nr:hypothetical protein [Chloroflexota bacterium]
MDDPTPIYEQPLRVSAMECDFKRELKPAAIFRHLSEAAAVHATQLGVGFEAMYARNLFWVHSRMRIRFCRFPRADEVVTLRTWPKDILRRLLYIRDFEVLDAEGERIAAATSAWLIIDATSRRLVSPKAVDLALPAASRRVGLDEPLDRLDLALEGEERLRVRAGYSAVDILGHVNNSRYVDWICDAFPIEMYRDQRLEWLQVNYDHEVLPGQEVAILASPRPEEPGLWAVEGRNCANDTRAFEALLQWRP